MRKLLKVRSK